jgi:hypothetical protein
VGFIVTTTSYCLVAGESDPMAILMLLHCSPTPDCGVDSDYHILLSSGWGLWSYGKSIVIIVELHKIVGVDSDYSRPIL